MGKIKVKRGSGVPSGLTAWEIAYDFTNDRFYIGNTTGASVLLAYGGGGVASVNGVTGAVTNIAVTNTAQTFTGIQSFTTGISASGGTFSGQLNAQNFKALTIGGDEGGQIDFGLAATNTSLTGGVSIDIYQNKVRIFESAGTNRGVYIDLTGVSAGVGTNLVTGGGGAVSSVSGSGNGILVSPTTGSVIVQNTGVHSFNGSTGAVTGVSTFNGLTGAVTGVTTGTANTFVALQSFTTGISASGGVTLAGTLQGTTATFTGLVSSTVGFSGAGTNLTGNASGLTAGTATGVNVTATDTATTQYLIFTDGTASGRKTLGIDPSTTPLSYVPSLSTLSTAVLDANNEVRTNSIVPSNSLSDLSIYNGGAGANININSTDPINIGDWSGNQNGSYITYTDINGALNFNNFSYASGLAGAYFSNGEYIVNSTNGQLNFMPAPSGSTAYGLYMDMTSWGFGVIVGTIRS